MTHFKEIQRFKKINVEGILLPNEPLTNFQLIEAAKKLKLKYFRKGYFRDELNRKVDSKNQGAVALRKNECGIVNTGDSSTNGFHWVCWYKSIALTLTVNLLSLSLTTT